ncbi:MAG: response regulator [Rivularia sp. ALOHA_DT_140]|nr:response regulator [Rivularia sp. ALOHA_DT_140]
MELTLSLDNQQDKISKPLILAVEDNEDNLLLVSYMAETLNCRFIGESQGHNVLNTAKKYQPNLILLDILLPDLNGFEIFQILKKDSDTAHIPVIALTALAMKEDRERIENAGFDEYVKKPYILDELENIIIKYIS